MKHKLLIALCAIAMIAGAQENRFSHLVITHDTTLNALLDNYDGITIKNGATLTITNNSFIRFADTSKVYVRNGSKLVVNNSTLTGRKNNLMWGGIIADTNCIVEILNNSVIERAIYGLYLIGAYPYTNRTTIHISNSTFRDCSNSIVAKNYEGSGYVNNNSFEVNSAACYNNSGHSFNTHIYLFNSIFPQIKGCHFSNNLSGDPSGTGIYSKDSYLFVVNLYNNMVQVGQQAYLLSQSTFSGFNYGIKVNNDAVYTCCVNGALFQNNIYGIKAENVLYGSFTYNDFSISNGYTNYSDMYGIHMNKCNYYTIKGNVIYSNSTTISGMTGIYVKDSNKNYHLFIDNVVNRMERGFWAEGYNATINGNPGLEFLCNSITNSLFGIYVNGYVQQNQGSITNSTGNTFSGNNIDLLVMPSFNTLNYYYYGSVPTIGLSTTINLYQAIAPRNCLESEQLIFQEENMTPNGYLNSSSVEHQNEQYIISAISKLYSQQIPTNKKHDELLQWYEVINTITAKYAMIELLQKNNRYSEADALIDSIPLLFTFDAIDSAEYYNYRLLYNLRKAIYQSGRDWNLITSTEKITLNNIATANGGRASSLAKSILELITGDPCSAHNNNFTNNKSILKDVAFYIDGEWCMQVKDTDYIQSVSPNTVVSTMFDSVTYYVYTNSEDVVVDSVVWSRTFLDHQLLPLAEYTIAGVCDSELDFAQYWCCKISSMWNGPLYHYTYLKAKIYVDDGQIIERGKIIRIGDCSLENYSVAENSAIMKSIVYPNPTNSVITLEWAGQGEAEVCVFSIDGVKLLQTTTLNNRINVETIDWKEGVYVYVIRTNDEMYSGKFVKR